MIIIEGGTSSEIRGSQWGKEKIQTTGKTSAKKWESMGGAVQLFLFRCLDFAFPPLTTPWSLRAAIKITLAVR